MPAIVRASPPPPRPFPGRAVVLPMPPVRTGRFSASGSATLAVVSGTVRSSIAYQYTPTGWTSGQPQSITPPSNPQLTLSNGSGANQVRFIHANTYLLSGAPIFLDLQALLDADNLPFSFATVRHLYLRNLSNIDGQILWAGGGPTPWDGPWTAGSIMKIGPSTTGQGSAVNNAGVFEKWEPSATGMPVTSLTHLFMLDPRGQTFGVEVLMAGA